MLAGMQIPEPIQDAYVATVDVVAAYASLVAAGAGAVGALIAIYTFRRFAKDHEHDEVAANLGVLLFLVVTTEGMWEVVHDKMGVPVGLTIVMFAAYDVVIYAQGATALRKLTEDATVRIGSNLLIIWVMSGAASITVSFAGGNAATWFFRFFSPMVAAALWTQKLLAKRARTGKRQESNWIWTPDRLLVRWGLKKPGAVDDLSDVFAQRRIAALVDAGMNLYVEQQAAKLRGTAASPSHATNPDKTSRLPWRRRDPLADALRRLQQLTKEADAETVAAARQQLRRVLNIETELFRDDTQPNDAERELLDELRRVMTQATTRLRVDHARAFGPDQPGGPLWSNGLVQMRTSVADQIRTSAMDQARTNGRTSPADQTRTSPPPVNQPATSGAVPAVRTTPAQRTTARVDRVRPVSPAAGGGVPPRIWDMVRDLKRAYRGDIPGRRAVMDRMGWTSAGDAQTAINLVRAERTKTKEN